MDKERFVKDSYCSYCGTAFRPEQAWPRTCSNCGNVSFRNPIPVAVTLLPVDEGLLVVRRGIEPGAGELALPGGYIEVGETWQEACARELHEETGVTVMPQFVESFLVRSTADGLVLIFGQAPPVWRTDLPPFFPNVESMARIVIDEPTTMAFPLHTEAVKTFFAQKW